MNRYIAAGIEKDLREGKFVVVVSNYHRTTGECFHIMAERLQGDPECRKITRGSGREEITMHNGGRLQTRAITSAGMRGFSADSIVVLDRPNVSEAKARVLLEYAGITKAELIPA